VAAVSEMVAAPRVGRVFRRDIRPGFADCSPSGRTRLDCVARWLQDVAYDDVEDAGLAAAAVWVLRRTRIQVTRWPRFGDEFTLATFCSGLGRMWAERRTTVTARGSGSGSGSQGSHIETVSLWVHLDSQDWRPVPLSEAELDVYGGAADGRRVTARLRHPPAPSANSAQPWVFRATELDIADHINNSAYWQPLEDELVGGAAPETGGGSEPESMGGSDPETIDVEIEFRAPAQPGEKLLVGDGGPLRSGAMRWIASGDGEVHASILVAELR
jgi:acyl-ACP thioesterase